MKRLHSLDLTVVKLGMALQCFEELRKVESFASSWNHHCQVHRLLEDLEDLQTLALTHQF